MKRFTVVIVLAALALTAAPALAKLPTMGTPAQLVQDLMTAGFDLGNMKIIKPELLKGAAKSTSGTRDVWTIADAEIYTDHKSGELQLIEFFYDTRTEAEASNKVSMYPMNSLSSAITGGKDALYKRYGKPHKETKCASYTGYTYKILFLQGDVSLWNISFGISPDGCILFNAHILAKSFSEVTTKHDGSTVKYTGTRSTLHNDLAAMGFAPGMPCAKPDVLARGEVDPSPPQTRRFANCTVFVDSDNRIKAFLFHEYKEDLLYSIVSALLDSASGLKQWPSGKFNKTLRLGKNAVVSRYGPPDDISADSSMIYYYVLLRDGDRLVPTEFSFQFVDYRGSSDNSAVGKVITNEYYLMPSP